MFLRQPKNKFTPLDPTQVWVQIFPLKLQNPENVSGTIRTSLHETFKHLSRYSKMKKPLWIFLKSF